MTGLIFFVFKAQLYPSTILREIIHLLHSKPTNTSSLPSYDLHNASEHWLDLGRGRPCQRCCYEAQGA